MYSTAIKAMMNMMSVEWMDGWMDGYDDDAMNIKFRFEFNPICVFRAEIFPDLISNFMLF